MRVCVRDACGQENPLARAAGVSIRKISGVGEVATPSPHFFQGMIADGRYRRLAEAHVQSAEPREILLGLADDLGTGLDCAARLTLKFDAP